MSAIWLYDKSSSAILVRNFSGEMSTISFDYRLTVIKFTKTPRNSILYELWNFRKHRTTPWSVSPDYIRTRFIKSSSD